MWQEADKDARRKRTNEVRLNAIREKSRKTEIIQAQIKKSIQGLDDNVKKSTHIKFSDSEDEVDQNPGKNGNLENPSNRKADTILGFSDIDSEEEVNIDLKPQFQGKGGERLLELQSSFGNDVRFRLDERFAEAISSNDEETGQEDNEEKSTSLSEVGRNLQLLSQVIGHDIKSKHETKKKMEKFIDVSARRYDPTKDSHLELKVEKKVEAKPKKKKKKDENEKIETDSAKYFEMSKEALRDAFAPKSEKEADKEDKKEQPFSFLAMFGGSDAQNGQDAAPKANIGDAEVKLPSVQTKLSKLEKQLHYDSSETEDEDEVESHSDGDCKPERTESKMEGLSKAGGCKSFFLTSVHDSRIVDGVREFCWNKPFKQIQQEWLEVKDTLIKDYKKKHRDAKRKQRRAKYEARAHAVNSDT